MATPVISADGSPRVFAARVAMIAAATTNRAATSSARANPPASAVARGVPAARSEFVRAVATADKIASPSAPPTWKDALMSALARPACDAGTPALAAV
jgi:hypothetical protein